MTLEVGKRYGVAVRERRKPLLIEASEKEFEGAEGTMLVFERITREALGEKCRSIVTRNTGITRPATRVAFVDPVQSKDESETKYQIGIFIPKPTEEGPDIGTTVHNVVDQLGFI